MSYGNTYYPNGHPTNARASYGTRNNMAPPLRPQGRQQRGTPRGNTWTREGAAGVTHGRYPTHAQPAYEQNQDNGVGRANFQQQGSGSIVRAADANVRNPPPADYVFNPDSDYADVYENPALRDAAAANIAPPANGWNAQAPAFVYQPADVQKPAESSLADFEAIVRKASKQVADGTAPNYYPGVLQVPKQDPMAQAMLSVKKGDMASLVDHLKVYNEQQPMQQTAPVFQPVVEQQVPAAVAQLAVPAVPSVPQPMGLYFPPPRQVDVLPELFGPMLAIWLKQESIQHWDEVDRIRIGLTPSLVPQTVDQVVAAMQICVDRVVEEERIRRELEDQDILRVLTETLRKEYELEAEAQEKLRAELDESNADDEGTLVTGSDEKEGEKEVVEEKEAVEVKAVEQEVNEKAADENELDGESVVAGEEDQKEMGGFEAEEEDVGELEMEAIATAEAPAVPQVAAAQMMAPGKPLSKKQIAEREQAAFQQDADRIKLPASTVSTPLTVSLAEALEKRNSMDEGSNSFKKQKVEAPPNVPRPRPARKSTSPLFANGSTQASRNAQRKKNNAKMNDGFAKIVTSATQQPTNEQNLGDGFIDRVQEANDEFAEITASVAAARAEAKRKMDGDEPQQQTPPSSTDDSFSSEQTTGDAGAESSTGGSPSRQSDATTPNDDDLAQKASPGSTTTETSSQGDGGSRAVKRIDFKAYRERMNSKTTEAATTTQSDTTGPSDDGLSHNASLGSADAEDSWHTDGEMDARLEFLESLKKPRAPANQPDVIVQAAHIDVGHEVLAEGLSTMPLAAFAVAIGVMTPAEATGCENKRQRDAETDCESEGGAGQKKPKLDNAAVQSTGLADIETPSSSGKKRASTGLSAYSRSSINARKLKTDAAIAGLFCAHPTSSQTTTESNGTEEVKQDDVDELTSTSETDSEGLAAEIVPEPPLEASVAANDAIVENQGPRQAKKRERDDDDALEASGRSPKMAKLEEHHAATLASPQNDDAPAEASTVGAKKRERDDVADEEAGNDPKKVKLEEEHDAAANDEATSPNDEDDESGSDMENDLMAALEKSRYAVAAKKPIAKFFGPAAAANGNDEYSEDELSEDDDEKDGETDENSEVKGKKGSIVPAPPTETTAPAEDEAGLNEEFFSMAEQKPEKDDAVEESGNVEEDAESDEDGLGEVQLPFDADIDYSGSNRLKYNYSNTPVETTIEAPPPPPRRVYETIASAAEKRQFAGNPALAKLARMKAKLLQ
ncbi:hypothetical protein LTR56_019200 [Elasticomyces elasticus]|nr:hypothetical protein LTR56_019200 [Elasticomyces elasticus]KAK3642690.1 hypothetical protein LTR22_015945 [Elasticomyces elasticus]KAK4905157.1 hypothetical protein LTR49_025505 [Elasticomyces elasticus]KAK5734471.1 hypothetical protein LTS12_026704 [Elasticomyces elasticus]